MKKWCGTISRNLCLGFRVKDTLACACLKIGPRQSPQASALTESCGDGERLRVLFWPLRLDLKETVMVQGPQIGKAMNSEQLID